MSAKIGMESIEVTGGVVVNGSINREEIIQDIDNLAGILSEKKIPGELNDQHRITKALSYLNGWKIRLNGVTKGVDHATP